MKPIGLRPSVKSRASRFFAYGCLAAMTGGAGLLIARAGMKDQHGDFVVIGVALPFIFVIGEIIRFRIYCGRIPGVRCIDCRHEFGIKELAKIGRCPQCQSKRVVGVRPADDEAPVVSLYPDGS